MYAYVCMSATRKPDRKIDGSRCYCRKNQRSVRKADSRHFWIHSCYAVQLLIILKIISLNSKIQIYHEKRGVSSKKKIKVKLKLTEKFIIKLIGFKKE